jgi:carboxylesterase type B
MQALITLFTFTVLCAPSAAFTVGAAVNTTNGPVQGQASALRPNVSEYLGIPFAQPPVGDLRFAAPVAAGTWTEVMNATSFVSRC